METAALVFACLAGPLTFGLLLAGFLQLTVPKNGERSSRQHDNLTDVLALLLEGIGLLGVLSALSIAAKNWPETPEARRFIYAGVIPGFATVSSLFLAL